MHEALLLSDLLLFAVPNGLTQIGSSDFSNAGAPLAPLMITYLRSRETKPQQSHGWIKASACVRACVRARKSVRRGRHGGYGTRSPTTGAVAGSRFRIRCASSMFACLLAYLFAYIPCRTGHARQAA